MWLIVMLLLFTGRMHGPLPVPTSLLPRAGAYVVDSIDCLLSPIRPILDIPPFPSNQRLLLVTPLSDSIRLIAHDREFIFKCHTRARETLLMGYQV